MHNCTFTIIVIQLVREVTLVHYTLVHLITSTLLLKLTKLTLLSKVGKVLKNAAVPKYFKNLKLLKQ